MRRSLPLPLARVAARIRDEAALPPRAAELFELVMELVDYIAACEHRIRARQPRLEPEPLARRLLADPQLLPIRRIGALLRGLTRRDLERIESLLLDLQGRHGLARTTPANFRLLLDGAILGRVGFIFSRKFQEVVAARSLRSLDRPSLLLPSLLQRADRVFEKRPSFLWRLGPEFGTDRNVNLMLERDDLFIVGGLYPARATRLARSVLHWRELGGGWVGESCEVLYSRPARHLVLKQRRGRRWDYTLVATNLLNVSWQEIVRFYRNRSGKGASQLTWEPALARSLRSRLAASFLIFAIFVFRNLNSWAETEQRPGTESGYTAESLADFAEVTSPKLLRQMGLAVDYLRELTGERLNRIKPVAGTLRYAYKSRGEIGHVRPLTAGRVCDVNGLHRTVTLLHEGGLSSVYKELRPLVRVGQVVGKGDVIGDAKRELQFEARLFADSIAKDKDPKVCDALNADGHATLDPLRLLCCPQPYGFIANLWRFVGVKPPPVQAIFLLENRATRTRVLFPGSGESDDSTFSTFDPGEAVDRIGLILADVLDDPGDLS